MQLVTLRPSALDAAQGACILIARGAAAAAGSIGPDIPNSVAYGRVPGTQVCCF
jgi:hypothetical protein